MDQSDLSTLFKTKEQANDFSARLATVAESMFQIDFNFENALANELGLQKKDSLLSFIRDNHISIASSEDIKTFINKLQETISSLPVLSLVIAFEPDEKTLTALVDWFLSNLNRQVLLDISVTPNLIAGAALTFGGKFFDFSIKQTVDRILKETIQQELTANAPIQQHTHQSIADITFEQ